MGLALKWLTIRDESFTEVSEFLQIYFRQELYRDLQRRLSLVIFTWLTDESCLFPTGTLVSRFVKLLPSKHFVPITTIQKCHLALLLHCQFHEYRVR